MRSIVLFTLGACMLAAQEMPDAEALIRQTGEVIQKLQSVQYDTDMTMEMSRGEGEPMKMTSQSSVARVKPGKMRAESKVQGFSTILVCDGEFTWIYNGMNKHYLKKPVALEPQALLSAVGMSEMQDLRFAPATVLRSEALEKDGQKHDCWVVEQRIDKMDFTVPGQKTEVKDGVMTYWIDKDLRMALQSTTSMKIQMSPLPQPMAMVQKMVIRNLKVNQPLPDSLFTFTPPADAKEVETLMGADTLKAGLAGTVAPAFEFKALDGKTYSLAALKGKPVLLDFWATWCSPCRQSLPIVDKIYQEYKAKGLVVLAVDAGEDRATVEGFLKKTPASTTSMKRDSSESIQPRK